MKIDRSYYAEKTTLKLKSKLHLTTKKMKSIITILLVTLMTVNATLAMELDKKISSEKVCIVLSNGEQKLTLEFKNYKNLEEFNLNWLNSFFEVSDGDCSVTATITVTSSYAIGGDIGIASSGQTVSVSVSAEITASCSEISDAIMKMVAQLKKALIN